MAKPNPPEGATHVREWGSQTGRPLVFWHALGAGTSGAYLTEVAPTLTEAGLRLIAPDAPGFGQSPALGSLRRGRSDCLHRRHEP